MKEIQIAERLERLDAEDEVGLAPGNEVAEDPVSRQPEVGLDGAAPLGHAVDLGLLDVEAFLERRVIDDESDGQNALPADAGQNDILLAM
jgi:hypothetical protein